MHAQRNKQSDVRASLYEEPTRKGIFRPNKKVRSPISTKNQSRSQAQLNPAPQTNPSDNTAESVDEITTLLSQSRIDPSTSESEPARLIRSHLPVELKFARTDKLLAPDHICFDAARYFCDRWSIPRQALNNFIGLTCGNPRFPMIMLQNPADSHKRLSLGEMISGCPTLKWLKDVLGEIGLKMTNIMILDVCPLLSSEYLRQGCR